MTHSGDKGKAPVVGPRPVWVRGNDWRGVGVPGVGGFVPVLPVSVVVPYFEAPEALELTLAALERQTYPRELFEVVVVDDGSRVPLGVPDYTDLDVRVVRQRDLGFGLARARNTGARAASYGILVFLDCDMMPESGWLAAHARWHHVVSDALTLGFRAHVEVGGVDAGMVRDRSGSLEELFSDRRSDRPEWIEFHMARTNDLTSTADDLFRVVTGGNLGVGRDFFEEVGGFDESFTQWGAEDTEFGYRAFTRGGLLVPEREAFCWHQGVGATPSKEEKQSLEMQRAKITHLIAHYGFRNASPGRSFTIPQVVVSVETGDTPTEQVFTVIENLLANRLHDLVIRVEDRPEDESFELIRRHFGPDPRVRFGPPDEALNDYPTAPFHMLAPAGAEPDRNIVDVLRAESGGAVQAMMTMSDGLQVSMTRTWALHRARRSGLKVEQMGVRVSIKSGRLVPVKAGRGLKASLTTLGRRSHSRMRKTYWALRRLRARVLGLFKAMLRIRNPRQGWQFLVWLTGAIRSRLPLSSKPSESVLPSADYPLGAEMVALGERAEAVFEESQRVRRLLDGHHTDLVLADRAETVGEYLDPDIGLVLLAEHPTQLSVPAIDPRMTNPVGWRRESDGGIGALGPLEMAPPGTAADRVTQPEDREYIRGFRYVVDVAAFHTDPISRAGAIAALAATGAVVWMAEADPSMEEALGPELYRLMRDERITRADPNEREALSIAMRREALRTHSLTARARQVISAVPILDQPRLPEVTVLALAAGPELLPGLLAAVSSQTYPRLETVLVLQCDRFGPDVERTAIEHPSVDQVVRVNNTESVGSALNRAVSVSRGTLITRMDDRNLYGPEHVWDLVVAREYSQAEVVAKGSEFFYLARPDRTVHLGPGQGEAFVAPTDRLGDGAMLVARHDLAAAGGWRRRQEGIGLALAEDVVSLGGAVYRTHGAGFAEVIDDSTQEDPGRSESILLEATDVWEGWNPGRVGLDHRIRPVTERTGPSGKQIPTPEDSAPVVGPRPVWVRGNDWRGVGVPGVGGFVPVLPVSVVVPYFEAPEALELTLAALERQTYPRELFEVVVVDDGSRVPLGVPDYTDLDVRVVRQRDLGFGLARARNTGARAASYGILVFLDCDMMPESGWLAAHARWHHVVSDALTLGFRAHVEVGGVDAGMVRDRSGSLEELFSDRRSDRPEWIEFHMARTNDLTSTADDLFRVVTGGNLGVGRDFFEEVGGFDESFTQWGAEDTEFGYRAFTRGGLLVPEREAFCWHQGVGATPSKEEKQSLEMQRAKITHLIAHYGFRGAPAGRTFTVPQYVVTVQAGYAPIDRIAKITEQILADKVHDLVVIIEDRPDDTGFEWLRREFGPDPRVRFGPLHTVLDEFPISSFHVTVPPGAEVGANTIHTLRNRLGSAVYGTMSLPDGSRVSITRTWALHRARRAGKSLAAWGASVATESKKTTPTKSISYRSRPATRGLRRAGSKAGRVLEELRRVRSFGQARLFTRWLVGAIGWRLRGATRYRRLRNRLRKTVTGGVDDLGTEQVSWFERPGAGYSLGAEMVTLGSQASDVFRDSIRVNRIVEGRKGELLVADNPDTVEEDGTPVVYLSEQPAVLSVPAFDPLTINPIGWSRTPRKEIGALGPTGLLPAGSRADLTIGRGDRDTLRSVRYVEDVSAFHPDVTARAATLAAVAGLGVVVHLVDRDPDLECRLGSELYGLMSAPDILEADLDERESISVRMRRAALREHSLRSRSRQIITAGLPDPPTLPEVSVLAATKRPGMIHGLLASVSAQTYPRIELVLVLHGAGFAPDIEAVVSDLDFPTQVLRIDGGHRFGSVLNQAVSASGGVLLTKIDDDDLYSEEHIWDLVLAHEYSQAELVAKGSEFVYLARSDQTIHRFCGRGEAASRLVSVAGGTMLISRHDLDAAGGWRRAPRGVDVALIEDVKRGGGTVYRTHGFGYVLVRHGEGHTWENDDSYFLRHAEGVRPGWAPEFAGFAPDARLPGLAL